MKPLQSGLELHSKQLPAPNFCSFFFEHEASIRNIRIFVPFENLRLDGDHDCLSITPESVTWSVAMATGMLIYQFEFVMPFEAHIDIGMDHSGKCHQTFSFHDI